MVASLQPHARTSGCRIVQILGGLGNPLAEVHAARLTERLAFLLKAEAHLLSAPGITGSAESTAAFLHDPFVGDTTKLFDELSVALVGIGALHPSRLLDQSGNRFSESELRSLAELGAVGDVCLRFFAAGGGKVHSDLDARVIGIHLEQLRRVPRCVGVAGGAGKLTAIRAALEGRWINVLITDRFIAERLVGSHERAAVPIGLDEVVEP
jgi:DNA-binding transcriptional regulator LsrR (DeoR family)